MSVESTAVPTAVLVGIGGAVGALGRYAVDTALVGTGFCGAFTTFSSFAVNVAQAASSGRLGLAAVNAVGTLVSTLLGVGIGWALAGL